MGRVVVGAHEATRAAVRKEAHTRYKVGQVYRWNRTVCERIRMGENRGQGREWTDNRNLGFGLEKHQGLER